MINEEKVAVMTRMAAYETGEGKKDIAVCGYFRSDYIGFQLLKSWICSSVVFCILAAIWLLYHLDSVTESLYGLKLQELTGLGKKALIAYAVFCGIYLLITYITAHLTYKRARRGVAVLDRALGMLERDQSLAEEEDI